MTSGIPGGLGANGGGSRELQVELEHLDEQRVCVRVSGELDLATAEELDSQLIEILAPARRVVLDLGELTFMDSTGLASIIRAANRAEGAGAVLEIAAPLPPQPKRLLELTGVISRLAFTSAPPRPPA